MIRIARRLINRLPLRESSGKITLDNNAPTGVYQWEVSRMTERITFQLNGEAASVEADPDMPLLYALRGDLGLSNPHFGCGLAQCGACTVHIDGAPARSCVTPVASVQGAKVTTLAGLGTPKKPHKLQQAFIDEQVPQCGYCLNGWIMTAAALLEQNPHPSDAEIRQGLTGLKCRCGTHLAILRAVKRAATA
jgi:aerobic-type carbon monoxide dehydrogenase small subunit (CoxS/CutS family)